MDVRPNKFVWIKRCDWKGGKESRREDVAHVNRQRLLQAQVNIAALVRAGKDLSRLFCKWYQHFFFTKSHKGWEGKI
jgi:hypothetical protein